MTAGEFTVLRGGHSLTVEPGSLTQLLQARHPAVYFSSFIGDAILTLPTVRALGEMLTAPITMICPKVAFELCFREVGARFVDIAGSPGPMRRLGPPAAQIVDYEALTAEIGPIDLFIDAVPWELPSNAFAAPLRQRLTPTTSIGFAAGDDYDIVVPKNVRHTADLIFQLARLFDPAARIETYAQPVPLSSPKRDDIRSLRDALGPGTKILVVHADTRWVEKRWPVTRFIDLLDRFLCRHGDFVAWVVGMGHEELNVGRARDRVFPRLGAPLDLAVGMVSQADLFVGVDSCMLHAADLAGVPGVGLFGPTEAANWGFRFAPHRHIDTPTMGDITVDEVLGAMEELVQENV